MDPLAITETVIGVVQTLYQITQEVRGFQGESDELLRRVRMLEALYRKVKKSRQAAQSSLPVPDVPGAGPSGTDVRAFQEVLAISGKPSRLPDDQPQMHGNFNQQGKCFQVLIFNVQQLPTTPLVFPSLKEYSEIFSSSHLNRLLS